MLLIAFSAPCVNPCSRSLLALEITVLSAGFAANDKKFNNIKSHDGLPYTDGEIYYCNWPQVVSREGNKKMFLTTTWSHPYEQTWMSHIYQETLKGNINPGILLATPTEHDRFEFYDGYERKES